MEQLECIELVDTLSEDEVLCGDDFLAQAESDICCKITDILVDGVSQGLTNNDILRYIQLHNITDPKLIQFVYCPRNFLIDVISNDNGSHNIDVDGVNIATESKADTVVVQCGQNIKTKCVADDCYILDYSVNDMGILPETCNVAIGGSNLEQCCEYNIDINQDFLLSNNVPMLDANEVIERQILIG